MQQLEQVLICGQKIPIIKSDHITQEQFNEILKSKKFQDYCNNFNTEGGEIVVKDIKITNVFMFGKNVGFVDIVVNCHLKGKDNVQIPGFAFLRGKSVSILVIVNNNKMILTKEFRVPIGKFFVQCPAGMMDEEGNFLGVAAKELKEETGISIKQQDLIYLGSIEPLPCVSDEEIILYALEIQLEQNKLNEILQKIHGDGIHEQISLLIEDYNYENIMKTQDAKLISSAYIYNELKKIQ